MRDSFDFERRNVGSPWGMACCHPDLDLRDDVPLIKAPDKKFKLSEEPLYIIAAAQVFPCFPRWAKLGDIGHEK